MLHLQLTGSIILLIVIFRELTDYDTENSFYNLVRDNKISTIEEEHLDRKIELIPSLISVLTLRLNYPRSQKDAKTVILTPIRRVHTENPNNIKEGNIVTVTSNHKGRYGLIGEVISATRCKAFVRTSRGSFDVRLTNLTIKEE